MGVELAIHSYAKGPGGKKLLFAFNGTELSRARKRNSFATML